MCCIEYQSYDNLSQHEDSVLNAGLAAHSLQKLAEEWTIILKELRTP